MKRYKLAASNIGWSAVDDAAVFNRMTQLGFEGIEVAPTRVVHDDPYSHLDEAYEFREDVWKHYGLRVCSVQSIWRGRTESIFDGAGMVALLAYTERAAAFAEVLGCHNMVFGCPRNRSIPEGHDAADAFPFLRNCARIAHAHGTVFALEANPPMYGTNFMNRTTDALDVIRRLEEPGVALNLDIGAIVAQGENKDVLAEAIPYASHVHVSEPGLAAPERRRLHYELRDMLEDWGYSGYVSLEMATCDLGTAIGCLEYIAEVFA